MGFYAGSVGQRRFRILALYAVWIPPDGVLRCMPAGGKVVFATKERAEQCERDLAQFTGSEPKRAYRCDRVSLLHWHVTSQIKGKGEDVPTLDDRV